MRINKQSLFSLEAIGFQKDNPARDLEIIIDKIKEDNEQNKKGRLEKEVSKYIKRRFNININFEIIEDDGIDAWAEQPSFNNENVLDYNYFSNEIYNEVKTSLMRRSYTTIVKMAKGELPSSGTLDYKNARVSGLFEKIPPCNIAVSSGAMEVHTSKAIASVILHELGHIWTAFEYISVMTSRNAIIAASVNTFLETQQEKEQIQFIIDLNNVWGLEIKIDNKLLENKEDISKVIIGNLNYQFKDSMGYVQYNRNMAESIADQFAVRCGGAEGDAEWMETNREYRYTTEESYNNKQRRNFFDLGLFSILSATCLSASALITINILGGVLLFLGLTGLFDNLSMTEKLNGWEYDNQKERLKRVYREELARLKNSKLDNQSKEKVLKSLDYINSVIEKLPDMDTFSSRLLRLFSSKYSKQEARKIHQQVNEELMNNTLYLQAAKFSTLK